MNSIKKELAFTFTAIMLICTFVKPGLAYTSPGPLAIWLAYQFSLGSDGYSLHKNQS